MLGQDVSDQEFHWPQFHNNTFVVYAMEAVTNISSPQLKVPHMEYHFYIVEK
jgi:hypothetical protein